MNAIAEVRKRSELRTGYSTGANATAAALAATRALLDQEAQARVTIRLPVGQEATFTLQSCTFDSVEARCTVIKDGGDDPDATHGAEIGATVAWGPGPGLTLAGGPGVGTVTRPGLGLVVGGPAINPVPRQMITDHVVAAVGAALAERGLTVTIFVTAGEAIARKTLNARLGIVGGISILGTSGLVIPYSTAAYRASIVQGMDVALAQGCRHLVITTGGRSEKFAQRLLPALPEVAFVQMGEFLGFTLKEAARREQVERVTIAGMVGKLAKTAQGAFHLHVSASQVDPAFLSQVAAECGAPPALMAEIQSANTARHFQELCLAAGVTRVFDRLCELTCHHCRELVKAQFAVECIMTDFDGLLLGRASLAARQYDPAEMAAARAALPDEEDEGDEVRVG